MEVPHFEHVDSSCIQARFSSCKLHRATLLIPFKGRAEGKRLCIVGQNPSAANEHHADKTIQFLERYVYEKLPEYNQILMLNLYSRIDTKKVEPSEINHDECEALLYEAIASHTEFLFVFGQLKNQRAYKFPQRVRELQPLFMGKTIYKLDIQTAYAPHPGNRAIHYHNTNLALAPYAFS